MVFALLLKPASLSSLLLTLDILAQDCSIYAFLAI